MSPIIAPAPGPRPDGTQRLRFCRRCAMALLLWKAHITLLMPCPHMSVHTTSPLLASTHYRLLHEAVSHGLAGEAHCEGLGDGARLGVSQRSLLLGTVKHANMSVHSCTLLFPF